MPETPEQVAARMAKVRAAKQAKQQAEQVEIEAAPATERPGERPVNMFSGFARRLEYFGEREGYRRRWFNDSHGGSNISNALKSGWSFVEREDVQLNAAVTPRNNDLGSHVRQYVQQDEAGQPMYAYLMEKPLWLCNEHDFGPGSREEYHQQIEAQIRSGTIGEKAGENRYSAQRQWAGSPSGLPPISISSKIGR